MHELLKELEPKREIQPTGGGNLLVTINLTLYVLSDQLKKTRPFGMTERKCHRNNNNNSSFIKI